MPAAQAHAHTYYTQQGQAQHQPVQVQMLNMKTQKKGPANTLKMGIYADVRNALRSVNFHSLTLPRTIWLTPMERTQNDVWHPQRRDEMDRPLEALDVRRPPRRLARQRANAKPLDAVCRAEHAGAPGARCGDDVLRAHGTRRRPGGTRDHDGRR